MQHWEVVVVGAGPAGLVAAFRAAECGRRTLLLEKNRRPGAKILMSGGTRCNLTHATDGLGIVRELGPQGRFLRSALSVLGPQEVVEMIETEGVATKVEQATGKVFPASDKAADVLGALVRRLARSGCVTACEEPLHRIERLDDGFLLVSSRQTLTADKVILATGGKSYPGCGTTGDGYAWAAALGHNVVPPRPALVPLRTDAAWVHALRGITIPDVLVKVVPPRSSADASGSRSRAPLAERRGSFLFTHFGLSGPAVLDVSRVVSGYSGPERLLLVCDFLPQFKPEEFDALFTKECATAGKRQLATILGQWLPLRLAETLVERTNGAGQCRAAEHSKPARRHLLQAETQHPIPNLFFAGELLDLDGPIGGYNFQVAFSTGWLAGQRC